MKRFIEGVERTQSTMFPAQLDEYVTEDNSVRVIDVFIDTLDLKMLGFERAVPADTGRPSYHPAVLLKVYVYGYLNRIQSSRRLERETQRNVELMWLTNRLTPRLQNHCRLPQRQRPGYSSCLPAVRPALPQDEYV
jgi:transposase